MKIIRGGGGIDADGNVYTLPREEVEVPDDWFERLLRQMFELEPREIVVSRNPFTKKTD